MSQSIELRDDDMTLSHPARGAVTNLTTVLMTLAELWIRVLVVQ
jgi:hypothetical protein